MDISELRVKIDSIDHQLLVLLKDRLELAEQIGAYKKEKGLPIRDIKREEEVLKERKSIASGLGIKDSEGVEKIFEDILAVSRKVQ
ncbi:MAG: chorismate mutase [Nanoarchaeota archaeon]|nr:chorismate mutase [Nanoarchaeota archaeon]